VKVEYSSNNSGGGWWLTDQNWLDLEAAGWKVDWVKDDEFHQRYGETDRFLGALATRATREGLSLADTVAEWERVTGEYAGASGCSCCGVPHNFTRYDDEDRWVDSWDGHDYDDDEW